MDTDAFILARLFVRFLLETQCSSHVPLRFQVVEDVLAHQPM